METNAWRAALIGLCVATREADVSTPEKAAANIRQRLQNPYDKPRKTEITESSMAPIPANVYWNAEHENFYGMFTRQGMGQEFFDTWFPRRDEFPKNGKK